VSLGFLQPLGFLGLLFVAVPVWFHLRERRQELTLPIPTVRFILEAYRRSVRRLRLRRLILLCLRILMVVLLSLILARPTLVRRESFLSRGKPLSTVLVVDDSPSMGYLTPAGTRLEEATRAAALLGGALAPPGEVAVLTTTGGWEEASFHRDADQVGREVARIVPSVRAGDPGGALSAAYRLLRRSSFPDRQILVLTDLARGGWEGLDPAAMEAADRSVALRFLTSQDEAAWNRAVREVTVLSKPDEPGGGLIKIRLAAFGPVPGEPVAVECLLDGRLLGRRSASFDDRGEASTEFPLPVVAKGEHRLEARLPQDALAFDDTALGTFGYDGKVRVLAVDGSPRGSLSMSETYYLKSALIPDRFGQDQRIELSTILAAQLDAERLRAHDVAILANVPPLEAETTALLASWVREGGGLLVTLGDNYQQGAFPESLDRQGADLLPVYLGTVANQPGRAAPAFFRLEVEPLAVFAGGERRSLERWQVASFVSPGPGGTKPGAQVLVAMDREERMPILSLRPLGKGRVVLLSTSVDMDWSNLPTQTAYLPLLHRTVEYLAGSRGVTAHPVHTAGGDAYLDLPEDAGESSLAVTSPDGRRLEAPVDRSSTPRAVLRGADTPGFYEFHQGGRAVGVPVLISRRESDTRPVPRETLGALARVLPVDQSPLQSAVSEGEGYRGSTDLAPWLFLLLVLILTVEGMVANGQWPVGSPRSSPLGA
jgi:hypothetical protein